MEPAFRSLLYDRPDLYDLVFPEPDQTRAEMKKILSEIQSGEFARQWINENKTGRKKFLAMRESGHNDQIEVVGRELREMMTFLKKKKEVGVPVG